MKKVELRIFVKMKIRIEKRFCPAKRGPMVTLFTFRDNICRISESNPVSVLKAITLPLNTATDKGT